MISGGLKVIILICFIAIAGYFILNIAIQRRIKEQLSTISPALQVKFSAVHVSLFSSFVSFDSLDINFIPYKDRPQNKHHLYFRGVSLKQIGFLKFLFNKKLEANDVSLNEGTIHLDEFLLDKKDSAQSDVLKQINWPFKELRFRNVELRANVFLKTDSNDQLISQAHITLGGVSFNKSGKNPSIDAMDIHLSNLCYRRYGIELRQLAVNSSQKILKADSLHYISPEQKGNEMTISSITMTGFDVLQLLNDKILTAKKMVIGDSKIAVISNKKIKSFPLPLDLKKIYINDLQGETGSIFYKNKTSECRLSSHFEIKKLELDPIVNNFHFGTFYGNLSNIRFSGNSYNDVAIKDITIDSKKELIHFADINIIPRFSKYEFGGKLGRQADFIRAFIPEIEIVKPDLDHLLNQKLFAEKLVINKSTVYVFRDRRLPRPQKNIPLPVDYLKTIPFDIRVGTCELATSTIEYEEYPKAGYGLTGILRIEKARATVSPVINHPLPSDPAYITMKVEGSIMGSGTTHGTVLMPLQKNKPYRIKGIFEQVDLRTLNSSSENLGKIRIKSGFLDFLLFDFTMTDQRSTGKIVGAYHHLIIQPLKKHTTEKNVADFASFMTRHAIIPLDKDQSLPERKRTGLVNYRRDPTRMVSYYYLQSLLMGVKKSFTLGFLLPK